MAQRVTTQLVPGMSREEIGESGGTVQLGYRGARHTIDLLCEQATALDDALAMYVKHATRVGGRRERSGTSSAHRSTVYAAGAVRGWARDQGLDVLGRGRIPQELIHRYHAGRQPR